VAGGDVAPLGRDAVTELHRLLDWAERSPRGLLLFIDEADAFLASRSKTAMSEDARNALNALLFRTGEASKKLMLVLATNRPGDLDAAVVARVAEALLIDLPDAPGVVLLQTTAGAFEVVA
jgi:ATPase family AAA domain-containing protein 3A/B